MSEFQTSPEAERDPLDVDPLDADRRRVLAEALEEAPFSGFSAMTLREAAARVGVAREALTILFPRGLADLFDFWSAEADDAALAAFAIEAPELRIRDKVTAAVRHRIEILAPHKEAARRAAAVMALPPYSARAPRLAWRTADVLWRACGDTATDYNHYTKRAILSGVYLSTLTAWFSDETETGERWLAFLDARIENVMDFEKTKARVLKPGFDPAAPWRLLGALRYGRAR